MAGIANDADVSMVEVLQLNFAYELLSLCTSVLISSETDVTLARNLEIYFPNFASTIRNITFQAYFTRNGVVVYQGLMFAGMTGIFTGMKSDGFAITLNSRPGAVQHPLLSWLRQLTWGWRPSALLRHTLESTSTYEEALAMLKRKSVVTPTYFCLAGTASQQATIVGKTLTSTKTTDMSSSTWLMVQTNDDSPADELAYLAS